MLEILNYSFITNALISAFFIGPLLGIIGTLVVSKKMAFYSEAIGHAAMTGIAIGIILGENYLTPYLSTFGYSILFGILIIYTKTKTDIASDTLIGIFLAVSISIGASLLTYTAGTINPHTKFTSEVYVLTKEEGGRHTPFFNGYRPQFYFRTTDVTGVIELPAGTEMVMPGDNVSMTIELITPIAIEKGLRFAIREGGRTVGSGVVADIIA